MEEDGEKVGWSQTGDDLRNLINSLVHLYCTLHTVLYHVLLHGSYSVLSLYPYLQRTEKPLRMGSVVLL